MSKINVAVFIGSNRKESYSKKLALALKNLSPKDLDLSIIDINDLIIYNQDLEDENKEPQPWLKLRETIRKHDAVLFITPEYNRSIPPVLKNALDIGSRPYGQNAWDKKPGAVISISPGSMGGFGANHHLRQVLACLNVPVMAQPEAYIGNIYALFDEDGSLKNERTSTYLSAFMVAFLKWIQANL